MKDMLLQKRVENAIDRSLSSLEPSAYQCGIITDRAMAGKRTRRRLPLGLVLAAILLLITATAVAATLLSPREVLEQVAVPLALENRQSSIYSHEELAELLRALDENGITLDENRQIVRAFKAGHGYWEAETVRAICESAFGEDLPDWTLEEKHVYGEACAQIGESAVNPYLLPGEDDMTQAEAAAFAARALKEKYGVDLPAESSDRWHVNVWFMYSWDDRAADYDLNRAEWQFEYSKPAGGFIYGVQFGRGGEWVECSQWPYQELLEQAETITDVLFILEEREGPREGWDMETWAELGQYVQALPPARASEWLYKQAGYRQPPIGSVAPEQALAQARKALGLDENTRGSILCCTDREMPIYKATLGEGDKRWCVELGCKTGAVRDKRPYVEGVDDPMTPYAPFSLLGAAPRFGQDDADRRRQAFEAAQAEKEQLYQRQYGLDWHFWPPEKQVEVYPDYYISVPTQAEYQQAVAAALAAIRAQEGQAAIDALGEYTVGLMFDKRETDGGLRVHWEVYITTDPDCLSDGWRVHYIALDGETRELEVLPSNAENG
ncbi:MAG: hypothetical protein IJ214_10085 [Clostridia bacterium]|nr:hypothetical protein [Clostridia bacterium]